MTKGQFEISARWTSAPKREERDVAELRLRASGEVLTRLVDFRLREERDFVRGSAVSLALWFADNFWRLRYESLPNGQAPSADWRLRHEITSASGGTLWPPIMIHSAGERILLSPTFAKNVEIGAIRYVTASTEAVSASDFEIGVDHFFNEVIEKCLEATDGVILQEIVNSIRAERSDPEIASWRRLEACLGYDPDKAPDALMNALIELEPCVGETALEEAAAATPGNEAVNHLRSAYEAAKESEIIVNFEFARRAVTDRISFKDRLLPPWQIGREAARRVRQEAGLGDKPILSTGFSDLLETTRETLKRRGTARNLPYSARIRQRGEHQKIALQAADQRDRRFEISCAMADELWISSDFGIMSKAKTDRQKFQRAFSQNLLAPIDGIERNFDLSNITEEKIIDISKFYHVHQNVINRLLILEQRLPTQTFDERIESA